MSKQSGGSVIHKIVLFGDPILRTEAQPVEVFDSNLEALADSMFATMYAAKGAGLAAPQIGVGLQIVVIDLSGGSDPASRLVLCNPEIIEHEGLQVSEEGCLSFPGPLLEVKRPCRVVVQAEGVTGQLFTIDADEELSIALEHEIDHLRGVLFIDRVSSLRRNMFLTKYRRGKKSR